MTHEPVRDTADETLRRLVGDAVGIGRVRQGVYANIVAIRHTQHEFILDFLLKVDEDNILLSRVILSPDHAKRLLAALQDNVEKYAQAFETTG